MPQTLVKSDHKSATVEVRTAKGKVLYLRPKDGVGVIEIDGGDNAEWHAALFSTLQPELRQDAPVELFVDTRKAASTAINIVEWISFLETSQRFFNNVHVLVASTVVSLSVSVTKHLSHTGNLIHIHTDAATYNDRLHAAIKKK